MAQFFEFTVLERTQYKMIVNLDQILRVRDNPTGPNTIIILTNGETYTVDETYYQVRALLLS